MPPVLTWDTDSSLGSSSGDPGSIHWCVVEWIWRKVIRKVEGTAAALMIQSGSTSVAGRVAGWCLRPPSRIIAVDDGVDGLAAVAERVRHATAQVRPVSHESLVDQMQHEIERFNPLWAPLESEAVRDRLLHEERHREERAAEAAERQRRRDQERAQREQERLKRKQAASVPGTPGKRRRKDRRPKRRLRDEDEQLLQSPEGGGEVAEGATAAGGEARAIAHAAAEAAPADADVDRQARKLARRWAKEDRRKAAAAAAPGEAESVRSTSSSASSLTSEEEEEEEGSEMEVDDAAVAGVTQPFLNPAVAAEGGVEGGGGDEPDPAARQALREADRAEAAARAAAAARPLVPVVPVPEVPDVEEESQRTPPKEAWQRMGLTGPPGPGQALKGPASRDLVPKPQPTPAKPKPAKPPAAPSPEAPPASTKRGHKFSLGLSQAKPDGDPPASSAAPAEPPSAPEPPASVPESPARAPSPSAPFRPPAQTPTRSTRSSLLPPTASVPERASPFSRGKPPATASPKPPTTAPKVPAGKPPAGAKSPAADPKPPAAQPAAAEDELQQRLRRHKTPPK